MLEFRDVWFSEMCELKLSSRIRTSKAKNKDDYIDSRSEAFINPDFEPKDA